MLNIKTWHDLYQEAYHLARSSQIKVANGMGSWTFIITQTIFSNSMDGIKCCWLDVPLGYISFHFLLNLLFFHAGCICSAYYYDGAKQAERKRDRIQAQKDYQTNTEAKMEIEALQQILKIFLSW